MKRKNTLYDFLKLEDTQPKLRYGDWDVLDLRYHQKPDYKEGPLVWYALVKCLMCKVEKTVRLSNLRSNHSKRCKSCSRKIKSNVKVGDKIGKLTVLKLTNKMYHKHAVYLCQCACGNTCELDTGRLLKAKKGKKGGSKSCGCNRPYYRYDDRHFIMLRKVYSSIRSSARSRNIDFKLSHNQVYELVESPCYYCTTEQSNMFYDRYTDYIIRYNGIDRIDSSRGYEDGNVVPCCRWCNMAKHLRTVAEFSAWALKLAKNIRKKKLRRFI